MNAPDRLCPIDDCFISRSEGGPGNQEPTATLEGQDDGVRIWSFPAEWSDDQIKLALSFANHAYARGVQVGLDRKAGEIRSALGLISPTGN